MSTNFDLSEFSDLFGETADLAIGNVTRVFVAHFVHQRVHFSRQLPAKQFSFDLGFSI